MSCSTTERGDSCCHVPENHAESKSRSPKLLCSPIPVRRVLHIDDDPCMCLLLKKKFKELFPEATIDTAYNGEDGVAKVHKSVSEGSIYDIVTVDHDLHTCPERLDGAKVIRMLRGLDKKLVLVGISSNNIRREHLKAGANVFMQKPIADFKKTRTQLEPFLTA
eukprot:CAMPEP_0204849594 /NCGR_PEP_ID=MMETSP1347-20130617/6566_1 /ASSEMBLY_ACC=CAM_ASM_000690 /TAXON_ID=215587 /ORGANISM="Aplanochytrium stocchinoi, Strain GSBS06" /LENGTH=163 /DNA_ID=CAMNT_0051992011 /DNA_START=254 /DNA_END=745 /DNA_ORIENTATION=+